MRVAEYTQGSTYYNGTTPSPDGIKYKDIVGDMYNGVHSYFYLVETQEYESVNTRPITPGQNGNSDTITTGWIVFNAVDAEFIRTLIAENAYITNLTAKQIVVTNNSGVPVAGVVSGQPIPTEIYDGTLNGSETTANHSGVRFFAGAPGNNNNLEDCNFVVREDGSGFAAGGNISWDNSGNFNFNIYNGGGYGQNMMSNCVVIERMEWTSDDTLNGPFNQIMLHICIVKNSFVVWYSTLILPYDDAVNCIREDDVILGSLPAATLLRKLGENQLIQQFFEVGTNVFVHAIDPKVYAPVSIGNNSLTLLGGIQFNHTIEWIPVSRLYWNGASAYITWPAVNAQSTMTVVTDYAPAVYQGSAAPTETDPNQVDPHNNP